MPSKFLKGMALMKKITLLNLKEPEQLGLVLDLLNQSLAFDGLTYSLIYEKTFGDDDFDPELAVIAYLDDIPVAFWMGLVRGRSGYHKIFGVRPQYRRLGIGSTLLKEMEERLIKQGVEEIRVCEGAPNYFMPGIDPRYTPALLFFEKHGYEKFDETYNMIAEICDIQPDVELENKLISEFGIVVRRASERDRRAVLEFIEEEFHGWEGEVSTALQNEPPTLFIAEINGRVIAFSAHESNNLGTGWFGPMGTLKSVRGKGIGRALLLRSLYDLKQMGFKHAIIPWVGPVGFYSKNCGARIDRIFWRFRKIVR